MAGLATQAGRVVATDWDRLMHDEYRARVRQPWAPMGKAQTPNVEQQGTSAAESDQQAEQDEPEAPEVIQRAERVVEVRSVSDLIRCASHDRLTGLWTLCSSARLHLSSGVRFVPKGQQVHEDWTEELPRG